MSVEEMMIDNTGRTDGRKTPRIPLTSDVALLRSHHANIAVLEPSRAALSENEVGRTLNQASGVDLRALVGQQRVLEARELTGVVARVGVRREGHGLAALAIGIGDIDIVQLKVGRLDAQRGRLVVGAARAGLREAVGDGDLVGGIGGGVFGVAVDGELGGTRGHEDLLVVGARLDEDALGAAGTGAQRVDGGLDGGVGGAGADGDAAGRRRGAAGGQGGGRKGHEEREGLHDDGLSNRETVRNLVLLCLCPSSTRVASAIYLAVWFTRCKRAGRCPVHSWRRQYRSTLYSR